MGSPRSPNPGQIEALICDGLSQAWWRGWDEAKSGNTLRDGAKGVDDPFLVITGPPDQRLGRPDSMLRLLVQRR